MRALGWGIALVFAALQGAGAVLVASERDTSQAPEDDPGFANVGTRAGTSPRGERVRGLSLIYLGHGWVLTANHVGESDLEIDGRVYPRVPGSGVHFRNPDGSPAELLAFRVQGNPDLPDLPALRIGDGAPALGAPVVLVGRGRNRGTKTTWESPDSKLRHGWRWALGARLRWGTNRISAASTDPRTKSRSFVMDFTRPGLPGATPDEAQAVLGDSGGAVFAKTRTGWKLVGVLYSASQHPGQPSATAFDGNRSYAVDLSYYAPQIRALGKTAAENASATPRR